MQNPTIRINGEVYDLATNLRVAYKVQGQNDHKPYATVFQEMYNMPVEKQIGVVYAAFSAANPDFQMSEKQFADYYLDNFNLKDLLGMIEQISKGIMGVDDEDTTQTDSEESSEKN